MKKRNQVMLIAAAAAVIVLLLFGSRMFYTIKPGERAVIFKKFAGGLDKDNIIIPGFHVCAPWNDVIRYDVKEQKSEEQMDVLDMGGLSITLDVTVIFNPDYAKIGYLHENIGDNYVDKMVIPNVRSAVRAVAGKFTAEEIYSTKRAQVENDIIVSARLALTAKDIIMKDLLIRSIVLPPKIKDAIEMKLEEQQSALTYQYTLEKAKSEAEKKRIEAKGIADYNRIISASITTNILKQKGIDATLQLAESPNTKVVVVGAGKDGLPLILGGN